MGGTEEEGKAIRSQQWRIEKPNSWLAQGGKRGIYTPLQKCNRYSPGGELSGSSRGGFSAPPPSPRIIRVKTGQKSAQQSAPYTGSKQPEIRGADYPAQIWADNPA
jgi:hypothetical protein